MAWFRARARAELIPIRGAPRYQPVTDGERPVTRHDAGALQTLVPAGAAHPRRRAGDLRLPATGRTSGAWWRPSSTSTRCAAFDAPRSSTRCAGVEPMGPQRDPWAKLGGQLATGSGKTKMMSLLIAWAYLNAVCEPDNALGLGRHAILIAPGPVREGPPAPGLRPPSDGRPCSGPIRWCPRSWRRSGTSRSTTPITCPRAARPRRGRAGGDQLPPAPPHRARICRAARSINCRSGKSDSLSAGRDPEKLEAVKSPLIERFARLAAASSS